MKPTSTSLILSFLRAVRQARVSRIIAYMATEPLWYAPGATRQALWSLARAGRIQRVGYATYQRIET